MWPDQLWRSGGPGAGGAVCGRQRHRPDAPARRGRLSHSDLVLRRFRPVVMRAAWPLDPCVAPFHAGRSAGGGGTCRAARPRECLMAAGPQPSLIQAETPDGVPMPRRLWAILAIFLGLTLAVLDGGIANVALPTIARDVNTTPANSIWVVNAYQLAVTISLLPLSSLGEIYGYKRVYIAGFILFTAASLVSALSTSLPTLIIGRMLQGFGAAGIMSVNSALIRFIYPRRWLGRGVGLNATVGSIASAAGPTVAAGVLLVAAGAGLVAGDGAAGG